MAISSTERRVKNVQIFVEKDAVETSFEKWAQPGHFSRTLAKGPKTTTWIWNLHADAHDFDSTTSTHCHPKRPRPVHQHLKTPPLYCVCFSASVVFSVLCEKW